MVVPLPPMPSNWDEAVTDSELSRVAADASQGWTRPGVAGAGTSTADGLSGTQAPQQTTISEVLNRRLTMRGTQTGGTTTQGQKMPSAPSVPSVPSGHDDHDGGDDGSDADASDASDACTCSTCL